MHHPGGVQQIEARPIPKMHGRMARCKMVALLLVALWLATCAARAQSVFEMYVGWGVRMVRG